MARAAHGDFRSQMLAVQVRKLLVDAHLLRERSVDLYVKAGVIVQRNKARVAQTRRRVEAQEQRRAARLLRETILEKLEAGRLPQTGASIVCGAPGVGGLCDACKNLWPTELVISVPWPGKKTAAQLHADCFIAWDAAWRSRAAFARPA